MLAFAMVADWPGLLGVEIARWKIGLANTTQIDKATWHVLLGVLAQLFFAWTLRRSLRDFLPWIAVLALELVNEANDLQVEFWPDRYLQYSEGLIDIATTMALPTVLLVLARHAPELLTGGGDPPDDAETQAPQG